MQPRSQYISPFSITGKSVSTIATTVNTAVTFMEDMKREYSPTVVYGVLALIPVVLLILILLLTKKASSTAQMPRSQKKSPTEDKDKNSIKKTQ